MAPALRSQALGSEVVIAVKLRCMGSEVALWKVIIFEKGLFMMPVIVFFVTAIPEIASVIWLLKIYAAVGASVIPSILADI
jgi:hypothetical protein